MKNVITALYTFLHRHPLVGWSTFLALTVGLVSSLLTLHYQEDITDFLPMDTANRTALSVYQDVSGANNVYAIVSMRDTSINDPQILVDGVVTLVENIQDTDTTQLVDDITAQVDMEQMMQVADAIYADIPLFLNSQDYARMDSLLAIPGYVSSRVAEDKEMLLFPSSQLLVQNIARDPLGLFSPVMGRLSRSGSTPQYDSYDGYILSPDGTKAIAIIRSSLGASESDGNARLLALLNESVARAEEENPAVDIHLIGGPVIAVSNAERIRQDSILAVSLSGFLILGLLIYVFRNVRNILLVIVSVGWGWLFAMGTLALICDSVSIIVIGIASVILGIAVNYPLHLIDHLRESSYPRAALREIISPLLIGNITTVGAFLSVVPLDAPSLHDLGLFSSLLLVGTIIFVLVFLPHVVKIRVRKVADEAGPQGLITRLSDRSIEKNPWIVWGVLVLTVFFGYFSMHTEFDSDMRNINYLTDEQRKELSYFEVLFNRDAEKETAYLVSSGRDWQEALRQNEVINSTINSLVLHGVVQRQGDVSSFLPSRQVQAERLRAWRTFLVRHHCWLQDSLDLAARQHGFSQTAFSPFLNILSAAYQTRDFQHFHDLTSTVFAANVSEEKTVGRKSIVQTMEVLPQDMGRLQHAVGDVKEYHGMVFDVRSMNDSLASTLSDNFNYIGFACGCIVFLFLWFSFGNVELAMASFVPMAVSWLWILGIMSLLGIKFNIVNIILATFIFGQGDDYTIFMTEGLSYEYAYRRKLLASYKNSIVVSALIMFIGIGTLNLAQHPALLSLGQVIVVGMLSVVLMAYLFPPLIFNWLVRSHGEVRSRPFTLGRVLRTAWSHIVFSLALGIAYMAGMVMSSRKGLDADAVQRYRKLLSSLLRFSLCMVPGVNHFVLKTDDDVSVLYYSHNSSLDYLCLLAYYPEAIILAHHSAADIPLLGRIMRMAGHQLLTSSADNQAVEIIDGMPGKKTIVTSSVQQACLLATRLHSAVRPIYILCMEHICPHGTSMVCSGTLYLGMSQVLIVAHDEDDEAEAMHERFSSQYQKAYVFLQSEIYKPDQIVSLVYDRFRYKGRGVETSALKALRRIVADESCYRCYCGSSSVIEVVERGQGELSLFLAMLYPYLQVHVTLASDEARALLPGCLDAAVANISLKE